jgi:hypothetical protein
MPVIRDIPLELKTGEILRREGFRGYARARPKIKAQTEALLAEVRQGGLLAPAASYEIYPIAALEPERITLEGGGIVPGSLLPEMFPKARELAAVVCTIGPDLEQRVTELSRNGEGLSAMILDGIGSAAVDQLSIEVCHGIAEEAPARGYRASSPVGPGMPGLAITEQGNILKLAGAAAIGVSLSASGIMIPRKSVSMVVALGKEMATWSQAEVCARCNLRDSCPYTVLRC